MNKLADFVTAVASMFTEYIYPCNNHVPSDMNFFLKSYLGAYFT
ncbi:unnamed protein product [Chrysodeixis includens]|uniref:Uncharacterized protein n=1 Tax=Chrysodeixis includens TaxID=689277 RepID=A0A9N8Q049_CHRIL|nr:unnamed protein product [Chrysodeixis includens]